MSYLSGVSALEYMIFRSVMGGIDSSTTMLAWLPLPLSERKILRTMADAELPQNPLVSAQHARTVSCDATPPHVEAEGSQPESPSGKIWMCSMLGFLVESCGSCDEGSEQTVNRQ